MRRVYNFKHEYSFFRVVRGVYTDYFIDDIFDGNSQSIRSSLWQWSVVTYNGWNPTANQTIQNQTEKEKENEIFWYISESYCVFGF